MSLKSEVVHIALVANERYMQYLLVAATSVAVFARPKTKLIFHICTEDVCPKTFEQVKDKLIAIRECKVVQHICDMRKIEALGLNAWRGEAGTRNVWVRVFFCEMMPDVDWLIYLDCDVLCLRPIETLLAQHEDAKAIVAVRDSSDWTCKTESAWISEKMGMPFDPKQYFNAGVLLFNLKYLRELDFPRKVERFIAQYGCPCSLDQTTLNALLQGRSKLISNIYNCSQFRVCELPNGIEARPIIHYCSGTPWSRSPFIPASSRLRLWFAFRKRYCNERNYEWGGGRYLEGFILLWLKMGCVKKAFWLLA